MSRHVVTHTGKRFLVIFFLFYNPGKSKIFWCFQAVQNGNIGNKSNRPPEACDLIKKESLAQVLSCEFYEVSKNTLSYRTPPVDASKVKKIKSRKILKSLKLNFVIISKFYMWVFKGGLKSLRKEKNHFQEVNIWRFPETFVIWMSLLLLDLLLTFAFFPVVKFLNFIPNHSH